MKSYIEARDAAADEDENVIRCNNLLEGFIHAEYKKAFQAGADWGAFNSPIVLQVVEALKYYMSLDMLYWKYKDD